MIPRLVLCLLLTIPTLACASQDLLEIGRLSLYSDADEKNTSRSQVKLERLDEGGIAIHYVLPEHPELRYNYAGFSAVFPEPAAGAQSLVFDAKVTNGAADPHTITLRTQDGQVYRREYSGYSKLSEQWQTIRIPLSDMAVPEAEAGKIRNIRITVASHSMRDDIDLLQGSIYFRNMRLSSELAEGAVKLPDYRSILADRPRFERPLGHAAWVYDADEQFAEQIASFNASSAVPISMLWVSSAELVVEGKSARLTPIKQDLRWWVEHAPPGVEVYAMIGSGSGRELGQLPTQEQERIGMQIAAIINQAEGVAGVHFDVEPYIIDAVPFYVAVKAHCDKPVSAALSKWDRHVMWIVDYPAAMAYGKSKDPQAYARSAVATLEAFADSAAQAGRTFYAGVVLAHTNLEYEYEENAETGERAYTGHQMEDYTRAVLEQLIQGAPLPPRFGGVGVWAFMPEQSKTHRQWLKRPRHVKDEALAQLRRFSQQLAGQQVQE